jgi:murein DD-endopeptidase MepM/ murein hydrolase activator NlpD
MRPLHEAVAAALTTSALACGLAPAPAAAQNPGGVQAPSAPLAGGSEYGLMTRAASAGRPRISELRVPRTAAPGRPPRVTLRIDEPGVRTVNVQVVVIDLSAHRAVITASLGWLRTGRSTAVAWPRGSRLGPGSYQVKLSVRDHGSGAPRHVAHSSAAASLTVSASPAAPAPPPPAPEVPAGVPTPAQLAAAGAAFPVAGPHNFGGPENRFGAPRANHVHQGQDVLSAEGTPVLAPLAGVITSTSYQAGGAGYYAVEHTDVGLDFMFAHCKAGSLVVSAGQAVAAGQALAQIGQTGDATTPHLHFEIWVAGWHAAGGYPIDPLPYLQAWDREGASS